MCRIAKTAVALLLSAASALSAGCANEIRWSVEIKGLVDPGKLASPLCAADPILPACDTSSLTDRNKVGVALFTFTQIDAGIAEVMINSLIRRISPENFENLRIAFVVDPGTNGEDENSIAVVLARLRSNYNVQVVAVPATVGSFTAASLGQANVVVLINPGHPASRADVLNAARERVLADQSALLLLGDDMSQATAATGFAMSTLTGMQNVGNGSTFSCNGQSTIIDNQGTNRYRVEMSEASMQGLSLAQRTTFYANDIDQVQAVNPTAASRIEVLARARPDLSACSGVSAAPAAWVYSP